MVNADNKVFQQIQTSQTDSPFGTGLILFANEFTGAPVEMNAKVREIFRSEDLFIGNNPLIQLQKALERLENGPWFVDCRGDVLYIHNRSFNTKAVHNYTYDHGNGEVLSISFKTQYRTKNAPRAATLSFDSFKKTLNLSSTGISIGSDQEIADRAAKINREENTPQLRSIPNIDYLTPTISNPAYYENMKMFGGNTQESVQAEIDIEFAKLQQQDYEELRDNLQDYGTYKNLVQTYLNGKGITQDSREGQYLDQKLRELKDSPEELDNFLCERFGNDTYTIVNDLYRPFIETLDLSELLLDNTFIPAYSRSHQPLKASYNFKFNSVSTLNEGDFAYSLWQFLRSKRGGGYTIVGGSAGISYDTRSYVDHNAYKNIKVTRAVKKKGEYQLSGYRLVSDAVSRIFNSPEGRYQSYLLNNALANSTKKITEARLEIEMRVIGRPSLTSSSKIHIENVGSRSDDYIIKTCIHRFASDGYTCSLTLVRGDYKVASSSDTASINLGKSSGNGNNPSPTDKRVDPSNTEFDCIPTRDELEYYQSFEGNMSKQTDIALEIYWHRFQAWKNGNLSSAQHKGVYHKHIDMDSEGNVTKVTWTQTPAPHTQGYQEFKTTYSREFYDRIRKKAADFKRYKK